MNQDPLLAKYAAHEHLRPAWLTIQRLYFYTALAANARMRVHRITERLPNRTTEKHQEQIIAEKAAQLATELLRKSVLEP